MTGYAAKLEWWRAEFRDNDIPADEIEEKALRQFVYGEVTKFLEEQGWPEDRFDSVVNEWVDKRADSPSDPHPSLAQV